jgi:large subunit ribosomal protein L13
MRCALLTCALSPYIIAEISCPKIIRHAVAGMLPKNKLRDRRLARLRIFPSYHMGKMGENVIKRWEDGTLKHPKKLTPPSPAAGKAKTTTA